MVYLDLQHNYIFSEEIYNLLFGKHCIYYFKNSCFVVVVELLINTVYILLRLFALSGF